MEREFIELPGFRSKWKELGLTEDDLGSLQDHLLKNPTAGRMIQKTGGLRKVRWAGGDSNKGKSGGVRVVYLDLEGKSWNFLIYVYGKQEKDNLSEDEKKELKELTKKLVKVR